MRAAPALHRDRAPAWPSSGALPRGRAVINPETGERIASCTIIVTDANKVTRPIHDRMPVVLDTADIRRWLSGEGGTELLKPAGEDRLRMWPVSRRVNKTGIGDDDPTPLLDEVAA